MKSPSDYYDDLVTSGDISNDVCQRSVLVHMDALYRTLLSYERPQKSFFQRLVGKKQAHDTSPPKGLYTHGTVGNGKTVLLKCFFETAPTDKKVYFHLHQFLLDVNTRLKTYMDKNISETDVISRVIDSYMSQAWLFCFDECVVGDIADAMLFGQISTGIIDRGGVLVCTSNFAPHLLKPRGGVGNNVFQRYAKKFFSHMHTHDMNSPTDYRVIQGENTWRYYWYDENANRTLDAFLSEKTTGELISNTVSVRDRILNIPRADNGICVFEYTYLIEGAFGAEDFMAIAKKYHTVVLQNLVSISADNTSLIKRFIVLVDCLYENKSRLVISANCSPQDIYPDGLVAFEFSRALSRLNAMQATGYSRA